MLKKYSNVRQCVIYHSQDEEINVYKFIAANDYKVILREEDNNRKFPKKVICQKPV